MSNFYTKSDSLNRYFKSIRSLNPLAKEEELILAERAQNGDRSAINKLVEHNLKIVVTIANKNIGRGIDVDDLIQQGNIGLYEAALRFDPSVNVRFSSFASTRILKSMNALIDTCGRIVRIPVNQEYQRYLAIKNGEEVSNLRPVELDKPVGGDDDESKTTMGESGIVAVAPTVEREYEMEDLKIKVSSLLSNLKDRDRHIIEMFYGLEKDDPMSSSEIAEEIGLTQIRVCQIVKDAKRKMKELV
jgi:RNA polymerase primary sigma factor